MVFVEQMFLLTGVFIGHLICYTVANTKTKNTSFSSFFNENRRKEDEWEVPYDERRCPSKSSVRRQKLAGRSLQRFTMSFITCVNTGNALTRRPRLFAERITNGVVHLESVEEVR